MSSCCDRSEGLPPKHEIEPLTTGKPYFHVILTKSHVDRRRGQLAIPSKFCQLIPSAVIPVVLHNQGNKWEMDCLGTNSAKRFGFGWKYFVDDNRLRAGDGCVFELMDEPNGKLLRFKVQILRGDFPPELLARINGATSAAPIIID